ISWSLIVALPVFVSLAIGEQANGLPLLGVVLWFALVRVGRWLSPSARTDTLLRRGRYREALALCDKVLAVQGMGAWVGPRRRLWLNRRTVALTALGQADAALTSALEAVAISADPETLGNCALALLRLNRYDEASGAARLTLTLTRERSVIGNTVLACIKL